MYSTQVSNSITLSNMSASGLDVCEGRVTDGVLPCSGVDSKRCAGTREERSWKSKSWISGLSPPWSFSLPLLGSSS